jgi:hypothetical protein
VRSSALAATAAWSERAVDGAFVHQLDPQLGGLALEVLHDGRVAARRGGPEGLVGVTAQLGKVVTQVGDGGLGGQQPCLEGLVASPQHLVDPHVDARGDQQLITVRLSVDQHARLRDWCATNKFSMAAVIRGLVERFLPDADAASRSRRQASS